MVNVFSNEINERLRYIFRLIFETVLEDTVEFFSDIDKYKNSYGIKINYSDNEGIDGLKLKPNGLLFQKQIQSQKIEMFEWEGEKAFFQTEDSFIPFDIFAASFYLVSRYEEYLTGKRDRHQRFMSRSSLAGQHRFLEKPLVNIWALKLADIIESEYPDFKLKRPAFKYLPTIDIDNAWAFKNKGVLRQTASTFKDLLSGRFKNIGTRFAVILKMKKDPYDNYDFMEGVFKKFKFKPAMFFLMSKGGKHDRGLSYKNRKFRTLIKKMSKIADIGIHPSYSSTKKKSLLSKEIKRLKEITGNDIVLSRQHYLKLTMPVTYRELLNNGIKADYSMGYSNRPGFRASICTPFPFFDLIEGKETSLIVYPFEVMDVTLQSYRGMSPAEADKKIKSLMKEVHSVGGTFISLWHNESLSDEDQWEGWKEVYINMTKTAADYYNG